MSATPHGSPAPGTEGVTAAREQMLKVLWGLGTEQGRHVSNSMLAAEVGLHTSTVSDSVRRMAEDGLVVHERYGKITLTPLGTRIAVQVVRRHRLLETFLVRTLGYSWDEVHEEADVLEHVVSDRLVERIDVALDHPSRDPHGDPIPDSRGRLPHTPQARSLVDLEPGASVRVMRILTDDSQLLRYFAELGLEPGSTLKVLDPPPYTEDVRISVNGAAPVVLGSPAAAEIITEPA